eukprot:g1662.t1
MPMDSPALPPRPTGPAAGASADGWHLHSVADQIRHVLEHHVEKLAADMALPDVDSGPFNILINDGGIMGSAGAFAPAVVRWLGAALEAFTHDQGVSICPTVAGQALEARPANFLIAEFTLLHAKVHCANQRLNNVVYMKAHDSAEFFPAAGAPTAQRWGREGFEALQYGPAIITCLASLPPGGFATDFIAIPKRALWGLSGTHFKERVGDHNFFFRIFSGGDQHLYACLDAMATYPGVRRMQSSYFSTFVRHLPLQWRTLDESAWVPQELRWIAKIMRDIGEGVAVQGAQYWKPSGQGSASSGGLWKHPKPGTHDCTPANLQGDRLLRVASFRDVTPNSKVGYLVAQQVTGPPPKYNLPRRVFDDRLSLLLVDGVRPPFSELRVTMGPAEVLSTLGAQATLVLDEVQVLAPRPLTFEPAASGPAPWEATMRAARSIVDAKQPGTAPNDDGAGGDMAKRTLDLTGSTVRGRAEDGDDDDDDEAEDGVGAAKAAGSKRPRRTASSSSSSS